MIASSAHRSRGFGTEALQHFVSYASKELGLSKDDFVVRIGMDNVKSLKLFEVSRPVSPTSLHLVDWTGTAATGLREVQGSVGVQRSRTPLASRRFACDDGVALGGTGKLEDSDGRVAVRCDRR